MNKEIETISEEQFLHNKLSFEINQELIHLMKRIIEVLQENKELQEKYNIRSKAYNNILLENADLHNKIDKAIDFLKNRRSGSDWYDTRDLLEILKEENNEND